MPTSSQALYFHLGMEADDDGIVEAFNVMRTVGFNEDDIKVLAAKGFIKVLNEDMVSFILDWREHNLIRSDRKIDSIYKELLLQMVPDAEVLNPSPRADTGQLPGGRPLDNQWTAQVRLGKESIPAVAVSSSEEGDAVGAEPVQKGRYIHAFNSMIRWAEEQRGFPFVTKTKQFKALKIAKEAKLGSVQLKERWQELEGDKFWIEKGFDWMDVVMSFNKRA